MGARPWAAVKATAPHRGAELSLSEQEYTGPQGENYKLFEGQHVIEGKRYQWYYHVSLWCDAGVELIMTPCSWRDQNGAGRYAGLIWEAN